MSNAIFETCALCGRTSQFGPNRYDGKMAGRYGVMVAAPAGRRITMDGPRHLSHAYGGNSRWWTGRAGEKLERLATSRLN